MKTNGIAGTLGMVLLAGTAGARSIRADLWDRFTFGKDGYKANTVGLSLTRESGEDRWFGGRISDDFYRSNSSTRLTHSIELAVFGGSDRYDLDVHLGFTPKVNDYSRVSFGVGGGISTAHPEHPTRLSLGVDTTRHSSPELGALSQLGLFQADFTLGVTQTIARRFSIGGSVTQSGYTTGVGGLLPSLYLKVNRNQPTLTGYPKLRWGLNAGVWGIGPASLSASFSRVLYKRSDPTPPASLASGTLSFQFGRVSPEVGYQFSRANRTNTSYGSAGLSVGF